MPGHTKVLNQRQILFAQAVALGKPLVEAYRTAGYTANSRTAYAIASQIARRPIVTAEIKRLQERARATVEMNADRWRTELTARYEQAAGGSRVGDQANALRALELWGRHLGILEPRTDDQAERTRLLTEHLAMAMGLQMAARQLPETATVTVEAQVRDTMALAPASEEPHAHAREADSEGEQQAGGERKP